MEKHSSLRTMKEVWKDFNAAYSLTKAVQINILLFLGLFFLDYKDIPSRLMCKLYEFPLVVSLVTGICILLFLLVWAIRSVHIITLAKFKLVTLCDFTSFTLFLSLLAYAILRYCTRGSDCIFIWSSGFTLMFLVFVAGRYLYLYNVKKKASLRQTNLVDLKDLAYNQFNATPNAPIQIAEKDVSYDLLGRNMIIDQLLQAITFCKPDKSYVISLEGPWGSGKTTILNSVKDQLKGNSSYNGEIIIIDDFDPWLYGNQNALLSAMYNKIILAMGLKCDPLRSEHFLKSIMNACASDAATKFNIGHVVESLFYGNESEQKSISELKRKISTYLLNSGKRFVFIIDNLDRANDENIIFLFKLISIVFDFPGIIYVLSFELERIDAILKQTHELEHRFLEKIIQQEIIVPPVPKDESRALYPTCMLNLMHAYGVSRSDADECSPVFSYIVEHTDNLRNFKRVLNSVFPAVFYRHTPLNLHDLFAIEAIHFLEPDLYYRIHDNPQYFISEGMDLKERLILNRREFNAAGAEFYSKIKQEFPDSMDLLAELFPYAKRFASDSPLEPEHSFGNPDSDTIRKKTRICYSLYFDLYFTATTNIHTSVSESVRAFVTLINTGCSISKIKDTLSSTLLPLGSEEQKEWVENLQLYLDDFENGQIYNLTSALTQIHYKIDDRKFFFALNAKRRISYIIVLLLKEMSISEFKAYITNEFKSYRNLELLSSLLYWQDSPKSDIIVPDEQLSFIKVQYYSMCNKILSEKIDIFTDSYYSRGNCMGLLSYCNTAHQEELCRHYFKSIMSEQNIYRILWDFTGCSLSSQYNYYISEKSLTAYIGNNDLITKYLRKSTAPTEDEEFVKQIYNKYIEGGKDDTGRPTGITSQVEKILHL